MSQRISNKGRLSTLWRAVAVTGLLASAAFAGIGEDVLTVVASNDSGSASYTLKLKDTGWDYRNDRDGPYVWALDRPFELIDSSSDLAIAKVSELSIFLRNDPQVNVQLSVQAGESDTSFTILTGKLEFDTITHASGTASSAFTLTDTNNNGAKLSGQTGPSSTATYWAAYNGDLPDAESFTEMLNSLEVKAGESSKSWSGNDPDNGGFRSLEADVSNMSTAAQFGLSAFDMLSGTSNFEIVPEPAGVLLLAVAALAARRSLR